MICEVAAHAGITLTRASTAGVDGFDLDELRRAGLRCGIPIVPRTRAVKPKLE